jgi:ABC-2 type transport system permease protein
MNRTWLIIKREFTTRVQKKSFLLTTILTPILIPTILGGIVYLAIRDSESKKEVIEVLDKSGQFDFKNSKSYDYVDLSGDLETAKITFQESDHKALLYIPEMDLDNPDGIAVYSKSNLSLMTVGDLENTIENRIEKARLEKSGLDSATIANLNANISIRSINLSDTGEEKESSAGVTWGIGYVAGLMIYMFIFIYGAQIMYGVIEEKNSRIVEILISSVRPFQLMMGKVLGIASVGLTQLLIWIVLISVLSTVLMGVFGLSSPSEVAMDQVMTNVETAEMANPEVARIMNVIQDIPFGMIMFTFVFYFIGGYLMYGALFAAVGSAVDSQAESQQFMLPITIPLIIAIIALSIVILQEPDGTTSFWLSIIPFTSPIAMMGRIAFGVPAWELALSMILLIGGFIFTIWFASRIYRVGILLHGTKVNYKVLAKWFMMRN